MKYVRILLSATLLTLPIAGLARGPAYSTPAAHDATLRFSWRMNVPARENCRVRTPEELEALPVHMRAPEECTRDESDFSIILSVNGSTADTLHLVRGGLKGDRPLVVLQDRRMQPGRHNVAIQLIRSARDGASVLAALDTSVSVARGDIALITLDAGTGRLLARTPQPR